jgi:hypothetical protein
MKRTLRINSDKMFNLFSKKKQCPNYDFYMNKIPSNPDGDYIDNIHKNWFGKYVKLESHVSQIN